MNICFAKITRLLTPTGIRKVENLRAGYLLLSEDGRIAISHRSASVKALRFIPRVALQEALTLLALTEQPLKDGLVPAQGRGKMKKPRPYRGRGFNLHTFNTRLAKHVGRDARIPANAFLIGRFAQRSILTCCGDKPVHFGNLLIGRFISRANFHAIVRVDQ